MHRVLLYTKKDCPLCDEAEALLARLQGEYQFTVDTVDIASDDDLFQRYRYAVPVVAVGDGLAIEAPVTEERFTPNRSEMSYARAACFFWTM